MRAKDAKVPTVLDVARQHQEDVENADAFDTPANLLAIYTYCARLPERQQEKERRRLEKRCVLFNDDRTGFEKMRTMRDSLWIQFKGLVRALEAYDDLQCETATPEEEETT